MPKFVFVTGGVLSGIGKGTVAAAIGKLFQFRDLKVDIIKIDPYLNVDPGTLNPMEHGEVFVTSDVWEFTPSRGFTFKIAEADQDLGTYERFLDENLHPRNNITSGQVYLSVVLKEREGGYLGQTVQIIPHLADEIKRRIRAVASEKAIDVLIVELGGTVGDIESEPFLEAVRQFRLEEGRERTALVHVALVPYLETVGQLKTKPVQHSVTALLSAGLQPDVVIGRSSRPLTDEIKAKIGLYSNVPKEAVISNPDIDIVYELPIVFENQGLGDYICRRLDLPAKKPETREWAEVVKKFKEAKEVLRIAMPGKYTKIVDSYISINEALKHAAASQGATVKLEFVDSELIERDPTQLKKLEAYDGILLTPGFGTRGVEGMISTAEKAISSKIPFLGICFGAQLLFIAFCRSIGIKGANSTEIDPKTPNPVVDLLLEQRGIAEKGGTMRLGEHEIFIKKDTNLFRAYGRTKVTERFRHRYHLIQSYAKKARSKGLTVSATDRGGRIINAIEIEGKDNWVVGTQFHPEFTSRPNRPNPVYFAFIEAVLKRKRARE